MAKTDEVDALRTRVAALEEQNRRLRGGDAGPRDRRAGMGRRVLAAVLVLLSVLLAPVAVIGGWARLQLVDSDRFVATFAPLAQQPEVQAFVADQAEQAIFQNVDIDALVGDLFDGIDSLGLPPRSQAAVALLEAPAAAGLRSLVSSAVERVVESPQFAQIWEGALRETHSRAIAIIQDDPGTVLELSDDGTLSIRLSVVIAEVRQALIDQGLGFASAIPEIDRTIPLVTADSLVLVRTVYQLSTAAGYWLPWIVLGFLVAGVAVARDRRRAVAWAGTGLALSLLLLAAGLGIGRSFFIATVSPSIMPTAAAGAIFAQLTALMSSMVLALVVLSVALAFSAWIAGPARAARAIRSAAGAGFSAVRRTMDRFGLDTRGFGRAVDRWRPAIVVIAIALGVLVLFLDRPATLGGVVGTIVAVLAVLLVVELLRRPRAAVAGDADREPADAEAEAEIEA